MKPRALLFDLDGVLVRSEEIWFRVVEEAGRRFRGTPVTREEFAPTFGQGTAVDVTEFKLRCTPAELDRFYVENFVRHVSAVWTDPDAADVLARLRSRGFKLAIVTNTVTPLAKAIVESAHLGNAVDHLVGADQVAHAKPAPDLLLRALELLGLPNDAAWMIGDSKYDAMAAKAAGVHFIGFKRDGDRRIEQLSGLLELV